MKPRKLRWNGKPAFCAWDGAALGVSVLMAAHTVAFFGNLAGLWGAEGTQDRLNLLGLLSAGWVLGNLGFYRLSRGKLLKGTLALLLALLFINVMILLFFAVGMGVSLFPVLYQMLF